MKIQVTQHDIDHGVPDSACRCPVALALRRSFALNEDDVRVNDCTIEIQGEKHQTPREVTDFIYNLDMDFREGGEGEGLVTVEPFEFDLPIEH